MITALSPGTHSTVMLSNDIVAQYMRADYEHRDVDQYATGEDIYAPVQVDLSWSCVGDPLYYNIKVAKDNAFTEPIKFVTDIPSITLENLQVATTYYWQVSARYDSRIVKSEIFSFSTAASQPRTVYVQGVSNTRDLGGWMTESGKRVRQGLLYRGGKLDDVTETGIKQITAALDIRTDLDLRGSEETGAIVSPLGPDVQFFNISCPRYIGGDYGINLSDNWPNLLEIMRVFADENNYPIYFHCSLGRDRTGTVAFLINALLGVSREDLTRDYELSFLSEGGCSDGSRSQNMLPNLDNIYNYIMSYGDGETLSAHTENFLLGIGMTQTEINNIRSIMLEEG